MEIKVLLFLLLILSSCSTLNTNKAIFVSRDMERALKFNNNIFGYLQFDYQALENIINRKCLTDDFSAEVEKLESFAHQNTKAYFYIEIGLCYQLANEFPKALYYYDQGLNNIKRDDKKLKSLVYNNLGIMFGKRDQFDTAYGYLEKSLFEMPNNFISVYNMAIILTAMGRYDESISLINKFNGVNQEHIQLTKILGINYLSLNDINSLETKVLNKLDDKLSEKVFLRAIAKYIKNGDSKVAFAIIEDLEDLNPVYQELYNNLIRILKNKIREDETKKTNANIFKPRRIEVYRT